MLVFDAPVGPDALTTFMREVPVNSDLALLRAAGTRQVRDNRVDWATVTRRNRTARYRSFDGRIHVSSRDTGSESKVALPALSTSLNMGEYERLQLEFARTGGTRREALVDAIYNDAEQLTREMQARAELALGDVLTDGVLSIDENDFQGEADFGVPADQIVAPATAWTDTATSTPITNLIAWVDVMAAKGVRPGAIRTSQRVLRLVLRNTEVLNAVHGSAAGRTYATLTDLNSVLADHGLPPFVEVYDSQVDVDGTATRPIPEDRVLLTPASLDDLIDWTTGISATALELVDSNHAEMSFEDSPGIVGVVIKEGPPFREFTFADAVGMPILLDSQRLLVADVAAF